MSPTPNSFKSVSGVIREEVVMRREDIEKAGLSMGKMMSDLRWQFISVFEYSPEAINGDNLTIGSIKYRKIVKREIQYCIDNPSEEIQISIPRVTIHLSKRPTSQCRLKQAS